MAPASWRRSMELEELTIKMTCNLPGDIMISNILPRLPIKTLVSNTIVNKTWYALMANRRFQELQYKMTLPDQEERNYVVKREFGTIYMHLLSPNQQQPRCRKIDLMHGGRMRIAIGVANGVVCFTSEHEKGFGYIFILHNPTYRREYLEVELNNRVLKGFVSLGYGYDSRNKDFKIVRIEQYEVSGQIRTVVDLYSNNTNSWRTFEPGTTIDGLLTEERSVAYVNGAIYWLAERGEQSIIVAFDLSEEEFREIMLPDTVRIKCPQIHVWRDQHLVAVYYYTRNHNNNTVYEIEVWMLSDRRQSSRDLWRRVGVYGRFASLCVVRGSTRSGKLMLFDVDRKSLVMYDPRDRNARLVKVGGLEGSGGELSSQKLDVLNYKQSLIKVYGSKMFDYRKAALQWIYGAFPMIGLLIVWVLALWYGFNYSITGIVINLIYVIGTAAGLIKIIARTG